MRSAGTIRDKAQARRFADFLLTRGISARLDLGAEGYTVWVHDEDRLAEVRAELPRFLAAPDDPRYNLSRAAESLREQARQAEVATPRPAAPRPAPAVASGVPAAVRVGLMGTPLALALIAFSVVVAIYTQFEPTYSPRLAKLTIATIERIDVARIGWNGLDEIRGGEVWRLLTPCFVHMSFIHLLFNMMWIFDLGRQIEASRGTLTLAFLVLVLGCSSNYAQYLADGPSFGGMSGVVFGLFGYVLLMARFAPSAGMVMSANNALFVGIWFCVCLTGAVGPIANWAHGVGLVLGLGFGGIGVWLHERKR
ncbi:rhomboid family intramembrane serine protease [Nannocystis sp.]|uniref:rhomboid family intramembrane serine protease n=1 Tax=Nannocystis sp. TaxID=1962667 RepID=UPI0025FBF780|nr:rhomboid family intramembrane serine protease [Nannocystis sp.]MBK7828315.1 rhomboid family intramembrane serine protease [Nannocystis sp.]